MGLRRCTVVTILLVDPVVVAPAWPAVGAAHVEAVRGRVVGGVVGCSKILGWLRSRREEE